MSHQPISHEYHANVSVSNQSTVQGRSHTIEPKSFINFINIFKHLQFHSFFPNPIGFVNWRSYINVFIVGPWILPIKFDFKCLNFTASVFKDNSARRINLEQIIVLLRVFEKSVESNYAAHIRASLGFQTFQILNADPSNSTWKYFVISKGTPKNIDHMKVLRKHSEKVWLHCESVDFVWSHKCEQISFSNHMYMWRLLFVICHSLINASNWAKPSSPS